MPQRESADKRIFSFEEASALLPEIRQITDDAYRKVEALGSASEEVTREKVNEIVSAWANAILSRGVEIKGLWLVDFDNGSGYYCWHYPEHGLQYYHSYEEGFQGRIRIH